MKRKTKTLIRKQAWEKSKGVAYVVTPSLLQAGKKNPPATRAGGTRELQD
jgi:hypothetical protein